MIKPDQITYTITGYKLNNYKAAQQETYSLKNYCEFRNIEDELLFATAGNVILPTWENAYCLQKAIAKPQKRTQTGLQGLVSTPAVTFS